MKICILSDSHDNRRLLEHAAQDAVARGAEAILHCGDIVAPTCLKVLRKFGLPVHAIHGNNTGDLHAMFRLVSEPGSTLHYHGQDAALELAGKRFFLVHYPHYAEGLALTGDYDIVCCGHDHRVSVKPVDNVKGGTTWLVNPGTVGGVGKSATYILADLEAASFEVYEVPHEAGVPCVLQDSTA